jgi:site-specific DNA recombinase
LRLSRSTEESTSIERQREIIQQWAEMNGHAIAGWAVDVDVSGSLSPFDTPELGRWLDHRAGDWDVLACWKLDRLSRSTINLNRLIAWCQDHGKSIVSTTESIDLSTGVGRLLAYVIGFLAEGELDAIRERQKASRSKLRQLARWPGGKPAYGYVAVQHEDRSQGWTLAVDPLASQVVRRIVEDVIDGKPPPPSAHGPDGLARPQVPRIPVVGSDDRTPRLYSGYLSPGKYYAPTPSG